LIDRVESLAAQGAGRTGGENSEIGLGTEAAIFIFPLVSIFAPILKLLGRDENEAAAK
jgi:hypothetical protein